MPGCDCSKTSRRFFARAVPGQPRRVVTQALVDVDSVCFEVELPGGGDEGFDDDEAMMSLCTHEVGEPRKGPKGGRAAGPTICTNRITVSLVAGTTAGLKIVELTAGGDTFALDVGVGQAEDVTLSATFCEDGTASVRIVDGAGAQVAVLGGFAICKAVP